MGNSMVLTAVTRTLVAATLLLSLPAQHDLRDRVTCTDGKVVTGRVVIPTAPDVLLVMQGGRRVRIAREDTARTDLVGDRVREFCERRIAHKHSKRAQWFLVDWAASRDLPGLARAQAMLLAIDDDLAEAHEFLGHRKTSKGWLWPLRERFVTVAQFEKAAAKKRFEIAGERFVVRSDGDLRASIAALLDLEHLGVVFYSRFGTPLQLEETLRPVVVQTSRSTSTFDKWGFRPVPYYTPPPHGDLARTFYSGIAPTRPEKLFFVATEGLLYRGLIGEVSLQSNRDRMCAWLEVGIGMNLENSMRGPAGYAEPGKLRAQDLQALRALGRNFRLSSLLHLPMYGGFYLMDDTPTSIHWAASTMLVTWLLEKGNQPPTREAFFGYVRQALGERKGDSSSLFDRAMGRRAEEMDEPWKEWLVNKAGK